MDTVMSLKLYGADSADLTDEAEKCVAQLEYDFSKSQNGSVGSINSGKAGEYPLDTDTYEVLSLSFALSDATDGALNVACAPLTSLWRIGQADFKPPSDRAVREVLPLVSKDAFTLGKTTILKKYDASGLDLGAVGKGYAADKLIGLLEPHSSGGVISLGGNIALYGKRPDGKPWKIALKDPLSPEDSLGYFELDGGERYFVSVTGGYERYSDYQGKRYIHVLDTESGYPSDSDLSGVCVISKSGTLSDGLSTALFVLGCDRALEFYESGIYDFEALLTKKSGETLLTAGLADSGIFKFND